MDAPGDITAMLKAWTEGKPEALNRLVPLVYDTLRAIASGQVHPDRMSFTATAIVHELYLRLVRYRAPNWKDRSHFFAFCARLMRQIITDRARSGLREGLRIDGVLPSDALAWVGQRETDYVDLDLALDRLAALSTDLARNVELRFYLGCTAEETAEIVGVSKATVDRQWAIARAWLYRQLRRSDHPGGSPAKLNP